MMLVEYQQRRDELQNRLQKAARISGRYSSTYYAHFLLRDLHGVNLTLFYYYLFLILALFSSAGI